LTKQPKGENINPRIIKAGGETELLLRYRLSHGHQLPVDLVAVNLSLFKTVMVQLLLICIIIVPLLWLLIVRVVRWSILHLTHRM